MCRIPAGQDLVDLRASSITFSTWGRVSIHLSDGSNLRRSRFVDLFKSDSASSSSSFLSWAVASATRWPSCRECARTLRCGLALPCRLFLGPVPKFVDAVFHLADAVADLCLRERELRDRHYAHGKGREDSISVCFVVIPAFIVVTSIDRVDRLRVGILRSRGGMLGCHELRQANRLILQVGSPRKRSNSPRIA